MTANHSMRRAVRRALAAGAIAVIGAGALAAQAKPAPSPQTTPAPAARSAQPSALQEIVVTGSLIRRKNFVTPNPVQVLTTKNFVQSGFTDFTSVLKNISSNGQGTLGQSFSFAFASGGSGIALHGLTVGDTLVMIDGQRSVPYPLLDDNERDFVDVSAFPMMAVQRVEVLSNGGSSIYGGDAIAGVVNVIMRKTYQGFRVMAETGQSQHRDATMEHLAFIGGEGNLDTDGYNWYVSGEFRHQDQVLASHRSGTWDSLNFTRYGGFNMTPGAPVADFGPGGGYYPAQGTAIYPLTPNGILVNPANTNQFTYLPGCSATAQAAGQCLIPNPRAQLAPPSTRLDLIAKFHKTLGPNWMLGVEASYFNSTSEQVGAIAGAFSSNGTGYPGGFSLFSMGPGVAAHSVPAFPLTITVPASYPGNPYGAPAPLVYPFPEVGPTVNTTDTSTERLLVSLTGHIAGWRIKATGGAMESKMILKYYGDINGQALQTALNNGYILGSSDANRLFAPVMETVPASQLDLINVDAQHDVFRAWGGEAKGAVGAEFYKEAHDERAPPASVAGLQGEPGGPVYVIGTQKVAAVYGELDTPVLKQLEVDASGRYDHYKGFGGSFSGQLSAMYTPVHWVSVRGNVGRAFRPPTAAEGISSGEEFGLGASPDPTLCPNYANGVANTGGNFPSACKIFPAYLINNGTNLKNVTSFNWGGGLVFRPISEVSASVDYYNIKVSNDIVLNPNIVGEIRSPKKIPLLYCPLASTQVCTASQLVTETTPVGVLQALLADYINASATHTSGLDIDLDAHYDAGRYGRISAQLHWTRLLTYQLIVAGTSYELAGTHGPSGVSGDTGNPKDRATLQVSWQKGPMTLTANLYYTGSYSLTDPSSGVNTCSDGLGFNGNFLQFVPGVTPRSFCSVGHFLSTNFYARYQVNGNFSVHGALQNAFNATPPLDFQTYGTGSLFYPYNAAFSEAGAIGRFWVLGATYNF